MAWRKWRAFAHILGNFQARVLLTVFYVILVGPVGLILRWRTDPLSLKRPTTESFWIERHTRDRAIEDAVRQS